VELPKRTHTEEFYERYDGDLDVPSPTLLCEWEDAPEYLFAVIYLAQR
jgi:hypothetical protein